MRVVFKHEDSDNDGMPVGPVTIIDNEEPGEPGFTLGRPYEEQCVCDGPHMPGEIHPNGGPCVTCGKFWRPTYRLHDAEAIAALHGVELEET